jgi:hypothetical protein
MRFDPRQTVQSALPGRASGVYESLELVCGRWEAGAPGPCAAAGSEENPVGEATGSSSARGPGSRIASDQALISW